VKDKPAAVSIIGDQKVSHPTPIAIVGIGCRFPGKVSDADSYWSLLRSRTSAICEIPENRWSLDGFYDPTPDNPHRSYSKWGGFLDDIASFDVEFFNLSRREAEAMDPQQRILLRVAYEAVEDAAISLERLRLGATGVYVGVSNADYGLLQRFDLGVGDIQAGTGTALSIVANRISNVLDLHGPSLCVDTACSSSLVAVDAACRALRDGVIDIGLAGGVNVLLDPRMFLTFCRAHMLSRTGRIAAFDAAADGFVRGEGAGIVVLKRLDEAVRDADRIYAVIEATAVNQDGRTDSITAPNPTAQKSMIRAALAAADIPPTGVVYVEAHGTGTVVGDPIEAEAIGEVLGGQGKRPPVLIGTAKGNIGHLEPAAGVAGLIKAALVLANAEIPPTVNFASPNPAIPFEALNIEVVGERVVLDPNQGLRALVNAFGFGGTNACVLLARHERPPFASQPRVTQADAIAASRLAPIPLSAPTHAHLAAWAATLATELREGDLKIADIQSLAGSLVRQRSHFRQRAVVMARDRTDLAAKLAVVAEGRDFPKRDKFDIPAIVMGSPARRQAPKRKLVFTCTGQGGQFWNMGREFLLSHPVFRRFVTDFDALFEPAAGWSVEEALSAREQDTPLHNPAVTPAAMFALQAGLAEVWKSAGVTPDILIGHSFGEVTAAYLAGAIDLADVAHLVNHRGLIRGHIDRVGAMAAIGMGEHELSGYLPSDGSIEIGAYNSPSSVTVSGDKAAIEDLIIRLKQDDPNIPAHLLDLDFAWHSSWLEPAREIFEKTVGERPWRRPTIPVISTVTGGLETRFDTSYWWRNLRCPVRYDRAVNFALDAGATSFIELGPSRTLSSPTAACAAAKGLAVVTVTTLQRGQDNFESFGAALAQLYVAGEDVPWNRLFPYDSMPAALPRLPWLPERLWKAPEEATQRLLSKPSHPLLGARHSGPGYHWSSVVSLAAYPVLNDHRLMGTCVLPAAVMIVMMYASAREIYGDRPIELVNIRLPDALFLGNDDEVMLHTEFDPERGRIRIWSRRKGRVDDWTIRAEASLFPYEHTGTFDSLADNVSLANLDVDDFYAAADRTGYHFGPAFRGIERIARTVGVVRAEVRIREGHASPIDHAALNPRLLDSCLQGIIAGLDAPRGAGTLFLPEGIERIVIAGQVGNAAHTEVCALPLKEPGLHEFSLSIADLNGRPCVKIDRLRARAVDWDAASPSQSNNEPIFIDESYTELPKAELLGSNNTRRWLIIAAPNGRNSGELCGALQAEGYTVTSLPFDRSTPDAAEAISTAIVMAEHQDATSIIYGVPLDLGNDSDWPSSAAIADAVMGLVEFGQTLARTESVADVWIATCNGRSTGAKLEDPPCLMQHALVSSARTLAIECPQISFHLLDVDRPALLRPETLVQVIAAPTAERELLVRRDKILAPRLNRRRANDVTLRTRPAGRLSARHGFELRKNGASGIDGLYWQEHVPLAPAPGEARVRVHAAGLNFRDVMVAIGLLPKGAENFDAAAAFGLEFCGVVESVGADVDSLAVGDRVFGMARGSLSQTVTIRANQLHVVPGHLGDCEAAGIPSVFLTAHYALNVLGRLRSGEAMLVHAGAGGLGLAAISLAKRLGAEVFATAGSPEKRAYLERLGVRAVFDSRSLSFAEEILQATGGRGVDLVLNAQPGPFIEKGLACIAPYGRFIELGKRDIYDDRSFGLKALRRNISLHVVDVAALVEERPDQAHDMLRETLALFATGDLDPLPVTVFSAEQVSTAFRTLAEARHIGKVAVDLRNPALDIHVSRDEFPVQAGGTYLVTGGLSGLGFEIGRQLAQAGAGRVCLASRSGTASADVWDSIARLRQGGADVVALVLDVTDEYAVDNVVAGLVAGPMPLKGIIHAAVAYDDALLANITADMLTNVLSPKVAGALNLTRAAKAAGARLDFFVSISSLAQVFGSRGQISYAAANAALEAVAFAQRACGIPGSCINLGMLGESGFVARNVGTRDYLSSAGWVPISNERAVFAVRMAMSSEQPVLTYAAADWRRLLRSESALAESERLAPLIADESGVSSGEGLARLHASARKSAARDAIRREVGSVLRLDPIRIGCGDLLSDLGIDSLSSFELWHRIEAAVAVPVPLARFTEASTVEALAELVCELAAESSQSAPLAAGAGLSDRSCDEAPK
jgi:acyl transferase domain-containing protein/acyl carrier protein